MIECSDDKYDFIFACNSIIVTFYLMKYFHLEKNLEFSRNKKVICSRKAFKSFCNLLVVDNLLLSKMHNLLVNEIFTEWAKMKKANPEILLIEV